MPSYLSALTRLHTHHRFFFFPHTATICYNNVIIEKYKREISRNVRYGKGENT